MDNPPFPKRRDVLLNHLSCKIKYLQPDFTEEILSTLTLDKNNEEIIDLLRNDSLLEEKVDKIVLIIDQDKREILGAELFHSVSQIEQELSAKITGMLLELPVSTINHLLTNSKDLENAVWRAKREFLTFLKNGKVPGFDQSTPSRFDLMCDQPFTKEHIGELLYEKLSPTYPSEAPKLTGMLLQMPHHELKSLLVDDQLLKLKVEVALNALEGDLQECPGLKSTLAPLQNR